MATRITTTMSCVGGQGFQMPRATGRATARHLQSRPCQVEVTDVVDRHIGVAGTASPAEAADDRAGTRQAACHCQDAALNRY